MDQSDTMQQYNLEMTREYDVTPEKMWDLWTDPEHLTKWWGPDYFSVSDCSVDLRKEGKMHIDMKGPDGTVFPMDSSFLEIVKPERLVLHNVVPGPDGNSLFEVKQTIVFIALNGKTKLTLKAEVVRMKPGAEQYLSGMNTGWQQSLAKLATYSDKLD